MATYGYTRVSSTDQVAGSSLGDQRRRIDAIAALRGDAVAAVYSDEGVSGSVPLAGRPSGAAMLAVLTAGDVVIVAKLDRMFRSASDALTTAEQWKAQGISLVLSDMGAEPVTENGVSRLFFGMLALVAEFERGRIAERRADGQRAKRAKGGHLGGNAPFGYQVIGHGKDASLLPVPSEQAAIAGMRAARVGGASLRVIGRRYDMPAMSVKRILEREA